MEIWTGGHRTVSLSQPMSFSCFYSSVLLVGWVSERVAGGASLLAGVNPWWSFAAEAMGQEALFSMCLFANRSWGKRLLCCKLLKESIGVEPQNRIQISHICPGSVATRPSPREPGSSGLLLRSWNASKGNRTAPTGCKLSPEVLASEITHILIKNNNNKNYIDSTSLMNASKHVISSVNYYDFLK